MSSPKLEAGVSLVSTKLYRGRRILYVKYKDSMIDLSIRPLDHKIHLMFWAKTIFLACFPYENASKYLIRNLSAGYCSTY